MNATPSTSTLTIGIDLGDRFSHFCVLDAEGEVLEEGRLRTMSDAFGFAGIACARIAIEAGTYSPWVCALLKEAAHEVLVANWTDLNLHRAHDRLIKSAHGRLADDVAVLALRAKSLDGVSFVVSPRP